MEWLNLLPGVAGLLLVAFVIWMSFWVIGPTEVGLVRKRFSFNKLSNNNAIAFNGEAGYQADLLSPGVRFKFWILYSVTKHPMVQIPAGQIGVVIAQVGRQLPIGAKSAIYKPEFGNFEDLRSFISADGQKGVQRPVLSPGSVVPIHPVGFLVITKDTIYGVPIAEDLAQLAYKEGGLKARSFGLEDKQLEVVQIRPKAEKDGKIVDMIGIVTTLEGQPIPKGAIANRLGDFDDIAALEAADTDQEHKNDNVMVEAILSTKNESHNNYQDFQGFIDAGGRIGLQHDPLLYGAYTLNPFLVSVEFVPMLVVEQGEVAVVKAYVGLATEDTSGDEFKFGSLVRPGHRGIWQEPLRTGKYAINPRCYSVEVVPTSILTLNWADATSKAHDLDQDLSQIIAKSKEGFAFNIDLQVQIHVPDSKAPEVISIVGSMRNLVNEVLQAAVGNHFRDKLQSMGAVEFIEKRQEVQISAEKHISEKLQDYRVETKGVYIQDVELPPDLVQVLKNREIANQQKTTYDMERQAQDTRIALEASRGKAEQQAALAKSEVGIAIAENEAAAVKKTADGEAYRLSETGKASAVQTREQGLAVAAGFEAQQLAVGKDQTTLVNAIRELANGKQRFVPENLALSLGGELSNIGALIPQIMQFLQNKADPSKPDVVPAPPPATQANGDARTAA